MASILRFAKHARRFTEVTSATRSASTIKYRRIELGKLAQCDKLKYMHIRTLSSVQVSTQSLKMDFKRVDDGLNRLDMNAKRGGRILFKDVEQVFNDILRLGKVNPNHSLLAIHCCGKLLADEKAETRSKLAATLWNSLETNECTLDISHYNALLKVHLENEYKFDATEFLAKIEANGLKANRVTYQRLISCYCQQGDIEGAGKILEHMKKEVISINEGVFNALIMGHARANNMEGARGVLDVMKNAKVQPSVDTYASLAYAYAEKGDFENILQVLDEVAKADFYLMDEHYLEIIYYLARNGHTQHVDTVLKMLRKVLGFNQDASTCILKLLNCGQDEIAMKIFNEMPISRNEDRATKNGQFLIRQLIRTDMPIDKVLKICKEMQESGKNTSALQTATHSALTYGKIDHALGLIKAMREEGLPIRAHYFWPILLQLNKIKADELESYEIINLMMGYGCPANYTTFVDYFYPNINTDNTSEVINKIKAFGYTQGSTVDPLVAHYVKKSQLDTAIELVKDQDVHVNGIKLIPSLATACQQDNNKVESALSLLQVVRDRSKRDSSLDIFGEFLMACTRASSKNPAVIESVLEKMISKKLVISPELKDVLQRRWNAAEHSNINKLLNKVTSSATQFEMDEIESPGLRQPTEMTVEEMENHLLELKNKGMNPRGILRKLLMHYCRLQNLQRAEEIKSELDALNFIYSEGMLCVLMNLYANTDRLDDAKAILKQINDNHPGVAIDETKALDFAAALVRAGQDEEALKFLNEQPVNVVTIKKDTSAFRVLNAAAEKGNVELAQKLFDVIMLRKLCEPNNVILGPLVKVHLVNDNLKGALDKFKQIANEYRCTPWRNQLFQKLIANDDADTLQEMIDLNSEIHGEMSTMYDLAFSFLRCGRIREAKKIFDTSGLRAKHDRLESECMRLIEDDEINVLEELVKVTRDLFDVNRDNLYYNLLKAYDQKNDYQKALEVWTLMQEEDVRPSERTLTYLANILEKNNQPIPFAVPEKKPAFLNDSPSSVITAIAEDNVDKALNHKQPLTGAEAKTLIDALIQKDRLDDAIEVVKRMDITDTTIMSVRFLMLKLAAVGNTAILEELGSKFTDKQKKKVRFNNVIGLSYISKDQPDVLLEMYEKDLQEGRNILAPGAILITLLKKNPHLIERVEKLAKDYLKSNETIPMNYIWMYYFMNEKYDKADVIFKETLTEKESLGFGHILETAELNGNVAMLKRLRDIVKASTSLPKPALGKVYNSLLKVQCALKQVEDAEATYKEVRSMGIDNYINNNSFRSLSNAMRSVGKDASILRTSPIKSSSVSSTSDSSSSDSDSEKKRKIVV